MLPATFAIHYFVRRNILLLLMRHGRFSPAAAALSARGARKAGGMCSYFHATSSASVGRYAYAESVPWVGPALAGTAAHAFGACR